MSDSASNLQPDRPLTVLLDGDPAAPQQARLGAALAQRGHRVLVLDAPKIIRQMKEEFGATAEPMGSLPRWFGPWRIRNLHDKARQARVDVVHINFILPHREVWTMPGAPACVATAWGSDLNTEVFKRSATHEAAVHRILQGAHAVTADSQPLLRKAAATMGGNPAPRELVFWGADLKAFDRTGLEQATARLREQLGIAPDDRVLLSPRQLAPHYHIDRIVRAFAMSEWPKDGVLVIKQHGKVNEAEYLNIVLGLAKAAGVRDRVRLAPRMPYEQLPALYAMAEAAVSLPEADGVPSTFLELMAVRVPVVCWNLAAYGGVVKNGERGGLTVPKGDQGALIDTINRIHADPELGQRLGEAGEAWARENADWSACVDKWLALYRQAIAAHASGGH
ncbi:MAG: glycosyltransferase family 4 protein [Deltaproteobacteria bacterium]|nr:glycosyltransferase family 4 protein [Deltaproteobacteria bacterium]